MADELVQARSLPEQPFGEGSSPRVTRSLRQDAAPKTLFWELAPDAVSVQLGEATAWEHVALAGVELPGFCRVRSGKGRKARVEAGPGATAEEITDLGVEASDVQIVCYMWTPFHLRQFEDLLDALEMEAGSRAKRKAVDVAHPGLNLLGISSLYVAFITVPEPSSVRGVYEFTIVGSQFKEPPKGKKATPQPLKIDASISSIPSVPMEGRAAPTSPASGNTPADTEAGP